MSKEEKFQGIEKSIANIEALFGKGAVMNLGSDKSLDMERIPTGSLGLDYITGGGYPVGRITELHGWESTGKTTNCIHAIVEAQKMGLLCAFIDTEHAFDKEYAISLGADISKILISQPDNGEEAFEITKELIKSGDIGLIIFDSLAASLPKDLLEADAGQNKMGLHARLNSAELAKIAGLAKKTKTCILFTNQLRHKIGVMFGNPETTSGGNAMKFYASIIINQTKSPSKGNKNSDGDSVSYEHTAKCVKNKTAPPLRKTTFHINFGEGIDVYEEVLTMGISSNVLEKSGSWYSYNGAKIGQSKVAKEFLKDNPEAFEEIKDKIREYYHI